MNRKIILSILAAAIICTSSLVGCTVKKTEPERTGGESTIASEPEKEHYHYLERQDETPLTYSTSDSELLIKSTCEEVSFVPYNRSDSEAAKNMNSVLDMASENHQKSASDMLEDIDQYIVNGEIDLTVLPWEINVDYSCTRNDGKAISVIESTDFYSAGKLEGTTIRTFNFNPVTGEQIKNIFYTDKASLDEIDDRIYNKLIEKYGEESGITYSMPLLTSMVDEALDSWYFTKTGIKIIFNPGSIAPIENGTFELDLTKQELSKDAQNYFNK